MREPIKDVSFLIRYLRDAGETENNPILRDAADALEREHEKHLGECVQIGRYSDELRGQKWISVDERLPEDERSVLTFIGYADPLIGFTGVQSFFAYDPEPHWQYDGVLRRGQAVLYWMPLPEQPKED